MSDAFDDKCTGVTLSLVDADNSMIAAGTSHQHQQPEHVNEV